MSTRPSFALLEETHPIFLVALGLSLALGIEALEFCPPLLRRMAKTAKLVAIRETAHRIFGVDAALALQPRLTSFPIPARMIDAFPFRCLIPFGQPPPPRNHPLVQVSERSRSRACAPDKPQSTEFEPRRTVLTMNAPAHIRALRRSSSFLSLARALVHGSSALLRKSSIVIRSWGRLYSFTKVSSSC